MLTGAEPEPPSVKIADFGLSVLQASPGNPHPYPYPHP